MSWVVVKDGNGNVIRCGEKVVAGPGETATTFDAPDKTSMEAMGAYFAGKEATRTSAVAGYDAKIASEAITHEELVKLLKLKGVI